MVGEIFALNVVSLAANLFYVIESTKMCAQITNSLIGDLQAKFLRTNTPHFFFADGRREVADIFSLPPDINGTKILAGITK